MEKMREEFEEWFYGDCLPCEANWFERDADGDYTYDPAYWGWRAWKAARGIEDENNG